MKKLILFVLVCVISTLSLTASIWERVDGPYDYAFVADIFEFNNQLFASSSSDSANYLLKDDIWNFTNINLPTSETILYFKQVDSNAIFSTVNNTYLTTNNGIDWKILNPNLKNDYIGRINQAEFTDTKVYANLEYGSPRKLYAYDFIKGEWEVVKTEDGIEEVFSDYVSKNGDYMISGSYGVSSDPKKRYGLFISSNNGLTWEKSTTLNVKVSSVILHNGIIIVGGRDQNLYKSKDYGQTWEVDTSFIFPVDLFYSDGNNLYAGVNYVGLQSGIEVGVHLSTDNGETWVKRHNGIWGTDIKKFLKYNQILYCQDDRKHIFQTSDNGLNWEICQIMTDSLKSYDFLRKNDTLIIATSGKRGLYYSTEEGTNWNLFGKGLKNSNLKIYQRDSIYITIINGYQNIGLSNDYGNTWSEVGIGVSDPFKTIIQDVEYMGGDTLIVATLFGTRITTDFGKTWNGLQNDILKSEYTTTNILRIDNNKLLIIAEDKGLFKSYNNGQDWEKVPTEFQTLYSTKFKTFEYLEGRVYAFLPNYGLFYSEDEGVTWIKFNSEFSEKGSDNGLAIYGEHIILSAKDGVLISNNDGENTIYNEIEIFASDDSFETIVKDIAIHGEYLIVASGNGVWRSKLSDLGIVKSSVESEIIPNSYYPYPQPAHTDVTIEFDNLNLEATVISIYNVEGKELRNQTIRINNNSIIWDCSAALPGIYLINIKQGSDEKTVKVVVGR